MYWSIGNNVCTDKVGDTVCETLDQDLLVDDLGVNQRLAFFQESGCDERNCGWGSREQSGVDSSGERSKEMLPIWIQMK